MVNICFLGPNGSYSEIAVKKNIISKQEIKYIPCDNFAQIYDKILNEDCIGVLPIENSTTSDIHENISFLFNNDISILGEIILDIKLSLIGVKNAKIEDIKTVYSHEKALLQSSNFIKNSGYKAIATSSTSEAKNIVLSSQNINLACVGNSDNLPENLIVLNENIANFINNKTRFLVLNKNDIFNKTIGNKFSIIFNIPNRIGVLSDILKKFADNEINITKIAQNPIVGTNFEYKFLLEGTCISINKNKILNLINDNCIVSIYDIFDTNLLINV